MEKVITVSDASISTVTIEVKVIQINNRQMTLSVFKQLIAEDIFDDTYKLKGRAWGMVNYHSKDVCGIWYSGSHKGHVHVIWQKGDELRRCVITSDEYWRKWGGTLDQLFIAV